MVKNLTQRMQTLAEKGINITSLKQFKELLERYGFLRGDRKLIMCSMYYIMKRILPTKYKPPEPEPPVITDDNDPKKPTQRKKPKKRGLVTVEEHIKYYRDSLFHIFKKGDPRFVKTMDEEFGLNYYGPLLLATMKVLEHC